jgi:hypothetical protein
MKKTEFEMKKTRAKIDRLREALDFIGGGGFPPEFTDVLTDAVKASIQRHVDLVDETEATRNDGSKWQPDELLTLETFLKGKLATGWHVAEEIVTQLADNLGRSPKAVKKKAVELGHGASVDHWTARERGLVPRID